jgi:AraC-like DNA-binding protein
LSDKSLFTHISTASSCPGLLFYFNGGFSSSNNGSLSTFDKTAVFYGQTNNCADYTTKDDAGIFGVQFQPYAIPALFSMPSSELTNQMPNLNMLLGSSGIELAEQIFFAPNFQSRVALITRFLERKVDLNFENTPSILAALTTINKLNGSVNTEYLAKQAHFSQRQFERKFKELSGFTPKSYARIVRFEYAMNCLMDNPQPLTDVALQCGYYDQAHFNHDFKTLSGYTPKAYYENYLETTLL